MSGRNNRKISGGRKNKNRSYDDALVFTDTVCNCYLQKQKQKNNM